jgi:hypothetical protein
VDRARAFRPSITPTTPERTGWRVRWRVKEGRGRCHIVHFTKRHFNLIIQFPQMPSHLAPSVTVMQTNKVQCFLGRCNLFILEVLGRKVLFVNVVSDCGVAWFIAVSIIQECFFL